MLATQIKQVTDISVQPRIEMPQRLDRTFAASSIQQSFSCVQENQADWLVLDFRKTEFIDSSGIGALTQIGKLAWASKFRIAAWGMKPYVESFLKDTGCDLFIHFDSCLKAA